MLLIQSDLNTELEAGKSIQNLEPISETFCYGLDFEAEFSSNQSSHTKQNSNISFISML